MTIYNVSVPVVPLLYEDLSSSSTGQLADTFDVPGMRVALSEDRGTYNAALQVEATSIGEAKGQAAECVQEFLALLALGSMGFRIGFSGVMASRVPKQESASAPGVEGEIVRPAVYEYAETQDFLSLLKKQDSFEFEAGALRVRDDWPDWLRTALRLNYLAMVTPDPGPSFIVRYSALEVLTDAIEGIPLNLLCNELGKIKGKGLVKKIKATCHEFGLSKIGIERLLNQIRRTEAKGKVDRISSALGKCCIEVTLEQVKLVTKQRGTLAHTGSSSEPERLREAAALIGNWMQMGLRNIVTTRQWFSTQRPVCYRPYLPP